jgi:hypothetical protein
MDSKSFHDQNVSLMMSTGPATEASSIVLQYIVSGHAELQSYVASTGGGLVTSFELISKWHGSTTASMCSLLASLAHGNAYVKGLARAQGFLPLLVAVMNSCAMLYPHIMVSGNEGYQETI